MEGQEVVKKWLRHRPEDAQMWYGMKLLIFCEDPNITPKQSHDMDRLEARDIVWQYTQPFIQESPSKAKNFRATLKSFYSVRSNHSVKNIACMQKHYKTRAAQPSVKC